MIHPLAILEKTPTRLIAASKADLSITASLSLFFGITAL